MTQLHRILWLAVLGAMSFLLATGAWAQSGGGQVHRGVQYMRGAARNAAASVSAAGTNSPQYIPYNGGPVLPNPTIYAFWWGQPSDFPSDALDGIDEFLKNLDGSEYLHIADQYLFGATAHTRFGGNLFDSSAPPTQDVPTSDIVAEVYKVLTANGVKPDGTAIYAVYVSNFPNQNVYCAYHDVGPAPDGTPIHIMYAPNPAFVLSFCGTNIDPLFTPNRHSEATRAMASFTAHEVMELITDPDGNTGWGSPSIGEIGDPCIFIFQSSVPLTDSSRWKIQEIWSNEAGGCVQGAGRNARVLGDFSRFGSITAFDIPAAAYGTFSRSQNLLGAVAGTYTDATNELHAFLRDGLGNTTTIDPSGTGPGFLGGAQAFTINAGGAVAGDFADTNFVLHGFVRDKQGNVVTIDAPGAAGTLATGINNKGVVAGYYIDANSVNHGFVRDSLGNIVTFDAPGAVNALFAGTTPLSINANGAVTGNYLDANFLSHGFVRHQDGTITSFDAPGASQGTFALSINDFGAIAGYYTDGNFVSHGFVRDVLGHITTFDDPNAASGGTFALSINALSAIGGYYTDANGFPQSFVRNAFGQFYGLGVPGKNYGTVVRSINILGATAGYDTAATP